MKTILLLSCLLLTSVITNAQDPLLGEWLTGNGDEKVVIYQVDNAYFGKVRTADTVQEKAVSPLPESGKESRPMLAGCKFVGNNTWEYGKFYDATKARAFHCVLVLKNPAQLEIRLYPGLLPFHRTRVWTRSGLTAQVTAK